VTHPFHPLSGREFDLVVRKHNWAEDRVFFFVGEELRSIPAGWTDVDSPDPFVAVAAGRSAFRVDDLLALASLLDGLRPARPGRVKPTSPQCKDDSAGVAALGRLR
jgi:hypothetical protein